jgi:N-acetylneuraminate synthase
MGALIIAGRRIDENEPPYLIAELSANHGGSIDRALKIIALAAECGADAIKFQAYTADSMTLDCDAPGFVIQAENVWKGQSLYSLYRSASTPYEWFPRLFAFARKLGITPFATPFDLAAIEMLEQLETPAYKIASFEAVDLELVAACARTGKPLIVSTGLCSTQEIDDVLQVASAAGCKELALLKCCSAYPANPRDANLLSIPDMRNRFHVPIGYSDHTLGTTTGIAACVLGACMIEKHFIDDRRVPPPDSQFSLVPEELRKLIEGCREAALARGSPTYGATEQERHSIVFRRSLYATAEIAAGQELTRQNVRSIRPGYGLVPKHLPAVLNKIAKTAIRRGEPLTWDMLR